MFWFQMLINVFFDKGIQWSSNRVVLPHEIGEYRLFREILREKKNKIYNYGIYKNNSGGMALAKQCIGNKHALSSYWLSNEISVYRLLWKTLNSHPEIADEFPRIHIPKLIDVVDDARGGLVLLVEYIDGRTLNKFQKKVRIEVYNQVIRYLSSVSEMISRSDLSLKRIPQRTVWHALAIFPVILVRAILRHPLNLLFIFWATGVYLILLPGTSFRRDTLRFSHRDIDDSNIVVSGGDVWLIDFQISAQSHLLFDVVGASLQVWKDSNVGMDFFASEYMKNLLSQKRSLREFQVLSAYLSVYNLSLASGQDVNSVKRFFAYVMNRSL